MTIALAAILILALIFGPQLWASHTLRRHAKPRDDLPGSGGELARHLIERFELHGVEVEETAPGSDHYDPRAKRVRLAPDHLNGHSITAVAVAAHEVGHALQHARGYRPLKWRERLVTLARFGEKAGALLMFAIPILTLVTRAPSVGLITLAAGLMSLGGAGLVHLITLPVEWDASFRRALPILEEGYLAPTDRKAARRVLTAAALTYLAASLAGLLNLARWIAILRR